MKVPCLPLVLFGMLISCQARADNPANTVEVRATGAVTVPSDTVVLRLSITTNHADLQEAKKHNDQIALPVYQLAESQHLARPTLLATRVSFDFLPRRTDARQVQRQLDANQEDDAIQNNQSFKGGKKGVQYGRSEPPEPPEPPVHVSRDLEVSFPDLNQAVAFLAESIKWDAVRTTCEMRLGPLGFGVASRDKHLAEARRRAVAAAREKAQLLAEQNGLKLGRAILIYDDSSDPFESARPDAGPIVPAPTSPFGAVLPGETHGDLPAIRLVALRRELPQKLDLDQVPPAQITITASVRIVFEVEKR